MNKAVAISEEFVNALRGRGKAGGLMFDRKVTRVITPGTLIDEKFMDPLENNFLLSVHIDPEEIVQIKPDLARHDAESETELPLPTVAVGLAWLDLSSGDFFVRDSTLQGLASDIASIKPREILLDAKLQEHGNAASLSSLFEHRQRITYQDPPSTIKSVGDWDHMLEKPLSQKDISAFSDLETGAGASLLHYITVRLQGTQIKLQPPIRRDVKQEMIIDQNSLRALEIRTTLKEGNFAGSLLHSIRKTNTRSGARLLSQRLSRFSLLNWSMILLTFASITLSVS